ncbi:MAG TPA: hypothetical protein VHY36_00975 [Steroidobacteraceae bacterium]|nr:hypothetical protein [Steroidobacteraceae bacterium]
MLEHYASFSLEGPLGVREHRGNVSRLTLVDDVITRGRTLLAAAARIHAAFPGAEVSAFALLRTLDPCEGDVRWISGDARRRP